LGGVSSNGYRQYETSIIFPSREITLSAVESIR